jgi:hypothetical protein
LTNGSGKPGVLYAEKFK